MWAEKAEQLMGDKTYYDKVMKAKPEKRKAQYLDIVKKHSKMLRSIDTKGMAKIVLDKPKEYVIRHSRPNTVFIGLVGTSVRCIEDCDIEEIHGFPNGIKVK